MSPSVICSAMSSASATASGPRAIRSLERLAGHVGHRDEHAAVGLADVEHGGHVRVIERRGGARLVDEPLARRRVAGQLGRQELERDDPVEPRVAGAVDEPHTAAADAVEDLVVGNLRAR